MSVRTITLPIPDAISNRLNAPAFNSYVFKILGAPDMGGLYLQRLPGIKDSAVDGVADVGFVIKFFASNLWASILYTAFILGCAGYRGYKFYKEREDVAKTQYVNNSLILKRLLHVKTVESNDPAEIIAYNAAQRAKIDLYNHQMEVVRREFVKNGKIKKGGQYNRFQLTYPPKPEDANAEDPQIADNQIKFNTLINEEETETTETTTRHGDQYQAIDTTVKRRKGNFLQKTGSFIYRKILWPAYSSLLLAAFSYWIECITLATFVGVIGYITPWLLIIPAIPALVYLGIYHFRDIDYKKKYEQEEQEKEAAIDREKIVEETNHRLELMLLKDEEKALHKQLADEGTPALARRPFHKTNFDGFNYGANAAARSAGLFITKTTLIFGLLHYISFYFLECIKVATHVFLPAIPVVNLIGFWGFVAFSIGSGLHTMLNHHNMLLQNTNHHYDPKKELTMDQLKEKLKSETKACHELVNGTTAVSGIKQLVDDVNGLGGPFYELPVCALGYEATPAFLPDSFLETLYYFFTENMMGIFGGRALGVISTAMFCAFTPTIFGPGIFALVLLGGLIYAAIQTYEKRQNQMRDLINAIKKIEEKHEALSIAKHNLSMEKMHRQNQIAKETPKDAISETTPPSLIITPTRSPTTTGKNARTPSPVGKANSPSSTGNDANKEPVGEKFRLHQKRNRSGSLESTQENDREPTKRFKFDGLVVLA